MLTKKIDRKSHSGGAARFYPDLWPSMAECNPIWQSPIAKLGAALLMKRMSPHSI